MKKRIGKITIVILVALIPILYVAAVYLVPTTYAEPLDTHHSSWRLVRETADEDGATFADVYNLTTAGNFANKDSSTVANGGPFRIRPLPGEVGTEGYSPGSIWMFAICGKNYDAGSDNAIDNTFSFNMVGWSKKNGMLQMIAEGDGILGTQAVIVYPDGGDAVGELISETGVTYTNGTTTFTDTGGTGSFDGAVAGMMAYVTGTNLTNGYYAITEVTDANVMIMSGMASSNNNTDSTVQINPSFWADTINLDETTKWPGVSRINSSDNQVCLILVDMTGLEWVQFVIYDATPVQTLEAGDITVYGRRY